MLESHSRQQLMLNFLEVNRRHLRFEALMAGIIRPANMSIECYGITSQHTADIARYDVSLGDTNHPLLHIVRKGVPVIWQTLLRGVRIEEPRFRHFVSTLPGECGLYARPVFDHAGKASGVIAAFSTSPQRCDRPTSIFNLSCELFERRLRTIAEFEQLRQQLGQIRDVFKIQQQRQQQLDDLLTRLSQGERNSADKMTGIARDYSDIDDLCTAVESFECEILTQRLRQFNQNKKQVAYSLNLSPRTLAYKLTKYRCER
ncbi:helix-turn-helix domain-containing protein [Erwinia tracheiphila]